MHWIQSFSTRSFACEFAAFFSLISALTLEKMTDSTIFGFALRRNGTCLASERSCGATRRPFYACCPSGSNCVNPYNQVCCSSSDNCTSSAVQQPACADRSWDLYNNGGVEGAFFCCLNSTFGYGVGLDSNGCANPDYQLASNENHLQEQIQAAGMFGQRNNMKL